MNGTHQFFVGADLDMIQSKRPVPCAICDGRYTIDRLVELQLGPPISMAPLPLCPKHYIEAEGAIQDWRKTKTPPCVVNVSAVGIGTRPGIFG